MDFLEEIHLAIQRTWDSIGYDAVNCCGGEDNEEDADPDCIIEVILDADRLEEYGQASLEALVWFRKKNYLEQIQIVKDLHLF